MSERDRYNDDKTGQNMADKTVSQTVIDFECKFLDLVLISQRVIIIDLLVSKKNI